MKIREVEQLRERIRMFIVQEIAVTNLIAQQEHPEEYIPRFIENLTQDLHELFLDELAQQRK